MYKGIAAALGVVLIVSMISVVVPIGFAADSEEGQTTSSFTVATVVDITLSYVPISWGTLSPSTENNPANAGNPTTVTVESTTNVNVDIYVCVKGTNWSDESEYTITVDKCHYDNYNVAGAAKWVALTTSYVEGPNQGFFEGVSPSTAKNTYWFINIPVGQWAILRRIVGLRKTTRYGDEK